MRDVSPVVDGCFTIEPDGSARLLGGRCGSCGALSFPRPPRCAGCRSVDVDEVLLAGTGGTLWGWTSVGAAPPGYEGPVPYGFGIVELDEGIRVVTRLTEPDPSRLSFGQRMCCVVDGLSTDDDGNRVVVWAFAPEPT